MKKTNVQTNMLGRHVFLTEENAQAAQRHQDVIGGVLPPYVKLHPDGGEVVAVHTDREGALNITVSGPEGCLVTLGTAFLRIAPEDDGFLDSESHASWCTYRMGHAVECNCPKSEQTS
jgi:hypothetical protein